MSQKESDSGKRLLKGLGIVAIVAAAAVVCIFTFGAGAAVIGVGLAAATTAGALAGGAAAVVGAAGVIGTSVAIAAGAVGVSIAVQQTVYQTKQEFNSDEALSVNGREDEIPDGYEREETEESRKLTNDINVRYIITDGSKNTPDAVIVPDYQVNQPYYN
jgi:hypothetical protein